MGKLTLLCLQRFRASRDLEADLTLVAGLMRDVLAAGQAAETLHAVMRYILLMTDRPAATLGNLLRGIAGPTAEEAMVSTGERMMREAARQAYEQAYERGTTEGQRALLLRQIVRRFGPQPAELAAKVAAGSPADLERWAERVLEAATIDDLFA